MNRTLIFCAVLVLATAPVRANDSAGASGADYEYRAVPELSAQSYENLYLLGKVWGYLKYHHPRVTAGCFDWDQELLDVTEAVAVAGSRDEASDVIVGWMRSLSDPQRDCSTEPPGEVHFSVDMGWLGDEVVLGSDLTREIAALSARSGIGPPQHYVSLAAGVRNPLFETEESYEDIERLDWRYRLLALYRFWNIVEYWSPYRDLIVEDWDGILREFVPRFVNADDDDQYALELMMLIARVRDGHSNLWSALDEMPPAGTLNVPAQIRAIEGRPVVWRELETESESDDADDASAGLVYGDIVLEVNQVPVGELVDSWSPYIGASNRAALLRRAYSNLLRGSEASVTVRVDRGGEELELDLQRAPIDRSVSLFHDRDGDAFQMLTDDVAYLKLSSVSRYSVPGYLDALADCRGLIIDIRNYPSDFMVFALGQHLVEEATPIARFTHGDLEAPGTFRWTDSIELQPAEPFFDGRVVILVDEASQSQSEYTTMAFRAAPDAVVIGSQTAGADGNISGIPLPGGHRTVISGIGVFYPDKTPTQQVGIVPDIVVTPTIAGIRAGRDEVLERAVEEILPGEVSGDQLVEITRILHAPQ